MTVLRKLLPWMAALLFHALLALVADNSHVDPGLVSSEPRVVNLLLEQPGHVPGSPGPRRTRESPPAGRASRDSGLLASRPASRDRSLPKERSPLMGAPKPPDPPGETVEPPPEDESQGAVENSGGAAGQGGAAITTEMGWIGAPRKVTRRQAVVFPRILSVTGQEADCEARITITPLGVVSHVEITRSSGYTEVDASVEAALRGYLFEKDYSYDKGTAVATFRYHFRLGRLD